jgi:hypothetical protein
MTSHARHFARMCRERLVSQGMTEEQAAEACEEQQTAAQESERTDRTASDQVKPS